MDIFDEVQDILAIKSINKHTPCKNENFCDYVQNMSGLYELAITICNEKKCEELYKIDYED